MFRMPLCVTKTRVAPPLTIERSDEEAAPVAAVGERRADHFLAVGHRHRDFSARGYEALLSSASHSLSPCEASAKKNNASR